VLELEDVTRTFDAVTALDGLDLRVEEGEVVGLLGHNGAGKTTTVRLLAGLLAPDRGTVRVAGRDPVTDGPAVRPGSGSCPPPPSWTRASPARRTWGSPRRCSARPRRAR
jgi:ABC-2 type transport system ATP-binding protein